MSKYYLIEDKFSNFNGGSLFEYANDKLTYLRTVDFIKLPETFTNWIVVSENEAYYLIGKPSEMRTYLHNNEAFNKIDKLKTRDKCYVRNDFDVIYTIVNKINKADGLYFSLKTNVSTKTVPSYAIQLVNGESKYYLLTNKCEHLEPGTILTLKDGRLIIEDKPAELQCSVKDVIILCRRIFKEDAEYLEQLSINSRLSASLEVSECDDNMLKSPIECFNCDTFREFSGPSYAKLKLFSNTKNLAYFGNSNFLEWMQVSIVIYNSSKDSKLYLQFLSLGIRILSDVTKDVPSIIDTLSNDVKLKNNLISTFETLVKKEPMSYIECKVTDATISIFWYLLKKNKPLDGKITEHLKKVFNLQTASLHLKCGAALCLSHLVDQPCSLMDNVHTHLSERHCTENKDVRFTKEDVLIGLGKISVMPKSPNARDNFEKNIQEIDTLVKSEANFAKILRHLKDLESSFNDRLEIDYLIKTTNDIIDRKSDAKSNLKDYKKCVSTCLTLIVIICDGSTVNKVKDNVILCDWMKEQFKSFQGLQQRFLSHEDRMILAGIVTLYYKLLQFGLTLDEDLMTLLENFYADCKSADPYHIKVASALCLTYKYRQRSDKVNNLNLFLNQQWTSFKDKGCIKKSVISNGIGILNITLNKEDPTLSSKLKDSVNALQKCINDDNSKLFSEETQNHFVTYLKNLSMFKEEVLKLTDKEAFCDIAHGMLLESFKSIEKSTSDNKIVLECIESILDTLSVMCDIKKEFPKELNGMSSFMMTLNNLFEKLIVKDKFDPIKQYKLVSSITRIFWNILKTQSKITNTHFSTNLEKCFEMFSNNNPRIKLVSALCVALHGTSNPNIEERVESCLTDAYKDSKYEFTDGITKIDICIAIGYIALNNKSTKRRSIVKDDSSKSLESQVSQPDLSSLQLPSLSIPNDELISVINEETVESILDKMHTNMKTINDLIEPRSAKFSTDILGCFKIISENIPKFTEKSSQRLDSVSLLEIIETCMRKFLNNAFNLNASSEDDIMFDCIEMIMTIVRDMCDAIINFVKLISDNRSLINTMRDVLNNLVNQGNPSTTVKKLTEHIIVTYYKILKSDSTTSVPILPIETLKKDYTDSSKDDPIQIASALCLALMFDEQSIMTKEVESYLKNICEKISDGKIRGFSLSDIYTGLGHISVLPKCSDSRRIDVPSISTECDQYSSYEETCPLSESMEKCELNAEEYKKCILLLSDINNLSYADCINCVKLAAKIDDIKILLNILNTIHIEIDFNKSPDILGIIIDLDDNGALRALLKKCSISKPNCKQLLQLAKSRGKDIALLVAPLIEQQRDRHDISSMILDVVFCYLKDRNDTQVCEAYLPLCTDSDAYMSDGNTFCTKIIRELDIDKIEIVHGIRELDYTAHTTNDESALCIACSQENEAKVRFLVNHNVFPENDIEDSMRIAYRIVDLERSNAITSILKRQIVH